MLPRLSCVGEWRHLCPSVRCLVELGCGEVESTKDISCHVVVTIIGTRVFVERRYLS